MTSLSMSAPTYASANSKKRGLAAKKATPRLDPVPSHGPNIRGSITSITSAGEDVLAAWAELGGGIEALESRRRMR
jgi:hypothetical protein